MKKNLKFIMTFLFVMSIAMSCVTVFATNMPTGSAVSASNTAFRGIIGNVTGWIQFFAWGVAIGMLLYVGIKYMMASANEKADLKKGSISYVIGAVLIAATGTIVKMLAEIGDTINK